MVKKKRSPAMQGFRLAFLIVFIYVVVLAFIFISNEFNDSVTDRFKERVSNNCGLCGDTPEQLCATGTEIETCELLVEQVFSFDIIDPVNCEGFTPPDKAFCEASIEGNSFAVNIHNVLKITSNPFTSSSIQSLILDGVVIAIIAFIIGFMIAFFRK